MNKKQKNNDVKYMYTLISYVENGCDRTVGDYVVAESMPAAYDIVISVCNDLNKKYGMNYIVQSVMPE